MTGRQFTEKHLKDKKIGILGMGISNMALSKYFDTHHIAYDVFDRNPDLDITVKGQKYLGEDYLEHLKGYDVIVRSPGIKPWLGKIREAVDDGALLTSDTELFMKMCPAGIIGVTGSDGKTTTTSLIYEALKASGKKARIGGNIGVPPISFLDDVTPDEIIVMELSSFQLLTFDISPSISVITNLSPNHLDYHRDMEEYIEAKKNILYHQGKDSIAVLNYDNKITRMMSRDVLGKTIMFSGREPVEKGIYLKENMIVSTMGKGEEEILDVGKIRLKGFHNVENYMALAGAVYGLAGKEAIEKVAMTFKGVEHRNEYVGEFKGIKFYNDSIGSSPTRTGATLNSFEGKVILIAGGYDKNIPFDDLGRVIVEKVKGVVLIGPTAGKIKDAIKIHDRDKQVTIIEGTDLKDAVDLACGFARKGDTIVLSPASASFDSFKNFEHRGSMFKEYVNKLV